MPSMRIALFASLLLASAAVLTACPRPNGYRAERAFPRIDFGQMVGLYPIPDGSGTAAVLTKDGVVYRASLTDDAAAAGVYLDLRDRLIPNPEDEEGLLGLAFAPDFATSSRLYVYYTGGDPSEGDPRRSVISRFTAGPTAADPASERVILEVEQPYGNHNGGALAFGPDGKLYIALGDGGSGGDPHGYAQNRNVLLGKILRIDVSGDEYTVPADNPFAAGGGRGEIWAYGFRNPWRITFDRETGQLWTGDVGQEQWEEVDRVVPGGNYGWNIMEGGACYERATCNRNGLIPPRVTYSHDFGCSITGGYVYRGAAMPELRGWYVYGDFCSGKVWAVDAATNEGAAIPLADTGVSITSFAEDEAGELYLVTFENAIYRLVRK